MRASARVLVKRGYEGFTTNHVAAEAGVSIGSLYQYFPGKEALLAELIDRHHQKLGAVVAEQVAQLAAVPLAEAAPRFVAAVIDAFVADASMLRVLLVQLPAVRGVARLVEVEAGLRSMLVAYLRARRDELAVTDLELAAAVIVHTMRGVMLGVLLGDAQTSAERLAREVSAMMLAYLRGTRAA